MTETERRELPRMIGSRGSHDAIMQTLQTLSPGRALDAPAGKGRLSVYMRELGFDVHCADVDPGHLQEDGFPFQEIDLNEDLPYADDFFDVVVCANALHRVAFFRKALREFARILKPGGVLLISVNNYASIAKRLKFFLCGSLSETNNELTHNQTIEVDRANFRQSLFFPAIHYGLENAGLRLDDVRAQSRRLNHYLLLPFSLLAFLGSYLLSPKSYRRNCVDVTRASAVNFGGKSIFIRAAKPE